MAYTLTDIHSIYLDHLTSFAAFCRQHDLRYVMAGGTLLGAVREQGFIPWDDDVDLAMPREDYERFIACYDGAMQLRCFEKDKSFRFPYAKLLDADRGVVHVKDEQYGIDAELALAFDVYPIDGLGDDMREARRHYEKVRRLRRLTYLNMTRDKSPRRLRRLGAWLIRLIPTRLLMGRQIRLMARHDFATSAYCTRWRMPNGKTDIYSKDMVLPAVDLVLGSQTFAAPCDYDAILRNVYGDYQQPRREDEGLRHDVHANPIHETLVTQA